MAVKVLPSIDRLPQPLRRFMDRLTDQQKVLLVLKRDLFEGDWEPLITNLRARLNGQPYLVELAGRIEDDLERIEQIRQLEKHYGVDLAQYLQEIADVETVT